MSAEPTTKTISLSDYVEESRNEVERFAHAWAMAGVEDPTLFPLDMPPGEWDEQFRCWQAARSPDEFLIPSTEEKGESR